ncbi:unnamed protein product [Oikopleura dioica]|uniref:Uncharacterized protein n=1 Tax=Oikopleura dioica TaxID=34765 RepID=E4XTJ1_OIKDI|nr:unnamed protein product [Oikopleura dioica]
MLIYFSIFLIAFNLPAQADEHVCNFKSTVNSDVQTILKKFSGKNFTISNGEYAFTVNLCSEKLAISRLFAQRSFRTNSCFERSNNCVEWGKLGNADLPVRETNLRRNH